jgi:hypothetical protein
MGQIQKKKVCKCENCGNEAEMVVTCTLADAKPKQLSPSKDAETSKKVMGTAVCSHCGNEADMWIDI